MRKFLIKISYTLLPLWLITVAAVSWFTLCVCPEISGDIGRLGLIPFGLEYEDRIDSESPQDELFTTASDLNELRHCHADVITVGDSFSERGRAGYQNFLAAHGVEVMNCDRHLYLNPIDFAYQILDLGIVDSTNAPLLLVEVGERAFVDFMTDFNPQPNLQTMRTQRGKMRGKSPNVWSLARLRDFVAYRMRWGTQPIIEATLDANCFTSNEPRHLYFYYNDIKSTHIGNASERTVRRTFAALADKAAQKHIKLMVLVPTDKYDLYQDHIEGNPYPRQHTSDDISRIFADDPRVLVAKPLLLPLVERGVQDVYLYNDTHWSYKAARVVGDSLYNAIAGHRPVSQ